MPLYTRTGDDGQTSLRDGTRVAKHCLRVSVCGDLDDLNSLLGWCRSSLAGGPWAARIAEIQRDVAAVGCELASPSGIPTGPPALEAERSRHLETWIDEACAVAPVPTGFVLPGGCELAARLDVARACCRRAERAVVALREKETVRGPIIVYLNRLGDLLFAWARQANHEAGVPDSPWKPLP